MEGLYLYKEGQLAYRDQLALPSIPTDSQSDLCLIKVLKAGICSTDLGLIAGMYQFQGILGHEFVGIVEAGPAEWVGRRVVGDINIACRQCRSCQEGRSKHCLSRRVLGIRNHHGAFATYLTLPATNLFSVPETLPDQEAAFAEPLAAVLDVLTKVNIASNDRVLIVGDGRMGQLMARVLVEKSDSVSLVGKHLDKLDRLPSEVDAIYLNSAAWEDEDDRNRIGEIIGERASFDVVIECSGSPSGFQTALDSVRAQGVIVLKSTYPEPLTLDAGRLVVDEIRVEGSRCGDMGVALEFMAREPGRLVGLIDGEYRLEAFAEAFDVARRGVKVLFNPA